MKKQLAILMALLLLLVSACGDDSGAATPGNNDPNNNEQTEPAIAADDQEFSAETADQVRIASVTSDGPGWIVVYADDGFSDPLGHVGVDDGSSTGLTVTLNRLLEDGETLHARLHVDNPDVGDFDLDKDTPALDADGAEVTTSFRVTELAVHPQDLYAITAENQTLDPHNEVVVAHVSSEDDPVWVVIHEDNGGEPGEVIGSHAVTAGETTDLRITLDRDGIDGEALHAMIHTIGGDGETYDPALDPPALNAAGAIVMSRFVVTVEEEVVVLPEAAVEADDQSVALDAADEVIVRRVLSPGAGYIVIHADADGEPGDILGAAAVEEGENDDVLVTLDAELDADQLLHAMLHEDDEGEIGEPVIRDEAPVMASFTVTLIDTDAASITANDQTLEVLPLDVVTIAEVVYAASGWLVIHEDDAGNPGDIIGHIAVAAEPAIKANIEVTLDRDIADGETLYAMLHVDSGVAGTFEPGGADVPVEDALGNVIMTSFDVFLVTPSVTAEDQTLSDLSTVVTIAEVVSNQAGFIVIHADDSGDPGDILGSAAVAYGLNTDIEVAISRPATSGTAFHAMLHAADGDEIGGEVLDGADPVMDSFTVTVADGTPAVRLTLSANGNNYMWSNPEPAIFDDIIGNENNNQSLTLVKQWRYEVNNTVRGAHPLELITRDDAIIPVFNNDTVLLSQRAGTTGSFENNNDVNWVVDGDTLRFTVAGNFINDFTGYRCGVHNAMRSSVTLND